MKSVTILDKDYLTWVQALCERYRTSQIKAAVKVNQEMLHYYWLLGKEITEKAAAKSNRTFGIFYSLCQKILCAL